jgi:hypothetical protein
VKAKAKSASAPTVLAADPITAPPEEITPAWLNVVVMPNGEVICLGKTVGWVRSLGFYLRTEVQS